MAKADFLTGLVLFALGTYLAVEGLRMPGAGGFIEPGGEPGRVPVLLGAIIAGLAVVLVARAARADGYRLFDRQNLDSDRRVGAIRCTFAAAACSLYALGLLGVEIGGIRVRYEYATFVFLLVFIAAFEWSTSIDAGQRRLAWLESKAPLLAAGVAAAGSKLPGKVCARTWMLATAAVQSAAVTWAVSYVFETQFFVKLP
ncbi:MAG: hypothetical protein ACR2RL_03630 [Gammaproteobacteria bacterium]